MRAFAKRRLSLASGFPKMGVYDFRTEPQLLAHAELSEPHAKLLARQEGTLGWSILLRRAVPAAAEPAVEPKKSEDPPPAGLTDEAKAFAAEL